MLRRRPLGAPGAGAQSAPKFANAALAPSRAARRPTSAPLSSPPSPPPPNSEPTRRASRRLARVGAQQVTSWASLGEPPAFVIVRAERTGRLFESFNSTYHFNSKPPSHLRAPRTPNWRPPFGTRSRAKRPGSEIVVPGERCANELSSCCPSHLNGAAPSLVARRFTSRKEVKDHGGWADPHGLRRQSQISAARCQEPALD